MNAIDTNILAYAFDQSVDPRTARAKQFLTRLDVSDTVLLWQVAIEFGSVLRRLKNSGRFPGDPDDALAEIAAAYRLVVPSPGVLALAGMLRKEHAVSYWDSFLLAACIDAGVTTRYTEDRQSAGTIQGVSIVNPLAA
jgi:predicted nucleic acid-binding protein